ncbi:MAG: hypothetical protein KAT05_14955 [Spirochaetes bacterium]|nr:hypothetical protein [Spirochaetota bacterium]
MPNIQINILKKIRENVRWLFGFFFASIFIFAVIYNGIWLYDTGSFIIPEEMNEEPFQYVNFMSLVNGNDQIFLEQLEKHPLNRTFLKLDEITPQISQLSKELIKISSQQNDTEKQLALLSDDYNNLSTEYWDECWSNYYIALDTELEPLIIKRIVLNRTLNNLENTTLEKSKSDIELKISEIDYEIALTEVMFRNKTDFDAFCDPVKSSKLHEISNNEDQLFELHRNLSNEYYDKKVSLFNLLDKAIESRVYKLNFVDFLYFSTTTATTASFGDIIPNNTRARFIVIIQTIIGIIFIGLLVDHISNKIISAK